VHSQVFSGDRDVILLLLHNSMDFPQANLLLVLCLRAKGEHFLCQPTIVRKPSCFNHQSVAFPRSIPRLHGQSSQRHIDTPSRSTVIFDNTKNIVGVARAQELIPCRRRAQSFRPADSSFGLCTNCPIICASFTRPSAMPSTDFTMNRDCPCVHGM